jgi:NTP pyrophosphatase (non-canonical NTP hydrolase)
MELAEYQRLAGKTDQVGAVEATGVIIPLLGLAGEVGSLLAEYKKHLRDGPAHSLFRDRLAEDLGDLLWYLATVASKFDLDLDAIAEANLTKVADRWIPADERTGSTSASRSLDSRFPLSEQLPPKFTAEIWEARNPGAHPHAKLTVDGNEVGDPLHDNAYADDGYRFHDVMHLAHAAYLGWSPNLRAILKRKRKSDSEVDHVEDGARARIIEEAIVAIVFDYARKHEFLHAVRSVDDGLLKTVRGMTAGLEVGQATLYDWERAIIEGYRVWRAVRRQGGGKITVDIVSGRLAVLEP